MQLTQSQEDYLETIYVLKSQQDNVRAIDVAAALGFSKPSVSHALKDLKEKEIILWITKSKGIPTALSLKSIYRIMKPVCFMYRLSIIL